MERTLADVVLDVLRERATAELADFAVVAAGFDASPRAHLRAQRGVDEDGSNVVAISGEVLSAIVLTVGAGLAYDIAKDLLKDGLIVGIKKMIRWALRKLGRGRWRSDWAVPPLAPDQAAAFRIRAAALFVEYGCPAVQAEELATTLCDRWPTAPR